MDSRAASFTAANAIPWKIFRNADLMASLEAGRVEPIHVQLFPTNRCNLGCSFCSCANREKGDELTLSEVLELMYDFRRQGARSVTITGGGEPLVHERINEIILGCRGLDLEVGLVSNALEAVRLTDAALESLAWVRFSCSDELDAGRTLAGIRDVVARGRRVAWAFSYVLTKNFNPENLASCVGIANHLEFSHVRIVSDLTDLDGVPTMAAVKASLQERSVDDSLVIYQARKDYERGAKACWISLLKPVVGADGGIYPCCGTQYAEERQSLDLGASMRMGLARDLRELWAAQKPFDGTRCVRCYYGAYNEALAAMLGPIRHAEFV